MSPELETLDQLLGGSLPVPVVRDIFGDVNRFLRAVQAMLNDEEVRLVGRDGSEIPRWRIREVLTATESDARLDITARGAQRIG